MNNLVFSCVADFENNRSKYISQVMIWATSLLEILHVASTNIFINIITDDQNRDSEIIGWLTNKKIQCNISQPYDSRHRYCNKLIQLTYFTHTNIEYDYLIMMDCDTASLNTFIPFNGSKVYAKLTDHPHPPLPMLLNIVEKSGLAPPELTYMPGEILIGKPLSLTVHNNCNGGVYALHKSFVGDLTIRWQYWASWCIDNLSLFREDEWIYADQVSFMLAMHEMGELVNYLPYSMNYQLGNLNYHNLNGSNLIDTAPRILHYHDKLDYETYQIFYCGIPTVDMEISKINSILGLYLGDEINALLSK